MRERLGNVATVRPRTKLDYVIERTPLLVVHMLGLCVSTIGLDLDPVILAFVAKDNICFLAMVDHGNSYFLVSTRQPGGIHTTAAWGTEGAFCDVSTQYACINKIFRRGRMSA